MAIAVSWPDDWPGRVVGFMDFGAAIVIHVVIRTYVWYCLANA